MLKTPDTLRLKKAVITRYRRNGAAGTGLCVEKSEIVAAATIEKVDEPYEVLGRWFYELAAFKSIKGTIEKKHYLEIIYNVDSHWGLEQDPEPGIPFIVFLRSAEVETEAPQGFMYYHLVDHWKGLVALDENSKEQRASHEIMSSLGINVGKMSKGFMMSLLFCADTTLFHEANDAVFIYDALKLKRIAN